MHRNRQAPGMAGVQTFADFRVILYATKTLPRYHTTLSTKTLQPRAYSSRAQAK